MCIRDRYNMDGVDLDFEWAYSSSELTNYSKAIVKLRGVLGKNVFFTVSLHPVSYKITSEADVYKRQGLYDSICWSFSPSI